MGEGKENGDLLRTAESAGFDTLVTVDQGIPYQQSMGGRKLSILVLLTPTNQMEDLMPLMDRILAALNSLKAGRGRPNLAQIQLTYPAFRRSSSAMRSSAAWTRSSRAPTTA